MGLRDRQTSDRSCAGLTPLRQTPAAGAREPRSLPPCPYVHRPHSRPRHPAALAHRQSRCKVTGVANQMRPAASRASWIRDVRPSLV
jgi:hypothetical protein